MTMSTRRATLHLDQENTGTRRKQFHQGLENKPKMSTRSFGNELTSATPRKALGDRSNDVHFKQQEFLKPLKTPAKSALQGMPNQSGSKKSLTSTPRSAGPKSSLHSPLLTTIVESDGKLPEREYFPPDPITFDVHGDDMISEELRLTNDEICSLVTFWTRCTPAPPTLPDDIDVTLPSPPGFEFEDPSFSMFKYEEIEEDLIRPEAL